MKLHTFGSLVAMALVLATAGCGRNSGTSAEQVFTSHTPVKAIVVPKNLIHAQSTSVPGKTVGGRVYPANAVPSVKPTPAPAAPSHGSGNLHLVLTLAGKLSFCSGFNLTVSPKGKSGAVYKQSFGLSDLVGTQLEMTATNLAPGDYTVKRESLDTAGQVFDSDVQPAAVEASKTAELTL